MMKNSALRKHRYDVFLSHHSNDKPEVEILAARLENEAGLKPFLDKWHLVPGEPWQEGLEEALDQSASCAVFLGPSGLGAWENEEMRSALDDRIRNRSFRVIPVLLPRADPKKKGLAPRFLRRFTWVDFRAGLDDQDAFRRLVAGIQGRRPGPDPKGRQPEPEPQLFDLIFTVLRRWKAYLVSLLLLLGVIVIVKHVIDCFRPQPPILCGRLSESLGYLNKNQWQIPATADYTIHPDNGLSILKAPDPIFLKFCYYQNFNLWFHVRSINDGGAAWVVRLKDEGNYYLFYLAGPGNRALRPGFYFYIVQKNEFNPADYHRFFFLPFSDDELDDYLNAGAQFDIQVNVNGQRIQNWLTVATNSEPDDAVRRPKAGEKFPLGPVEDLGQHFLLGSIGFRTVGSEQFSVDYLEASPLP